MDKAVNNLLDKSPLHIYVALSVQASVAYKTKISHELQRISIQIQG